MREPEQDLQAEASVSETQSSESELQEWNPPTLTTWEVPKATEIVPVS